MPRIKRHTGSFIAKFTSGEQCRVNVFTEYLDDIPVLRMLELEDGTHVNADEEMKGEYETVEYPPRSLSSDDPNAV